MTAHGAAAGSGGRSTATVGTRRAACLARAGRKRRGRDERVASFTPIAARRRRGPLQTLSKQALEVKLVTAEGEVAVLVAWPFLAGPVPAELEAVLLGVAEVDGLVGPVVVGAVDRPAGISKTPQSVAQRGPGRIADGHVVQPGRPRRWRRTAPRLPCVEAQRVVVAAGGDEECVGDVEDDVEAKDVDVERPDPIQVARLEVHVAYVDAGLD